LIVPWVAENMFWLAPEYSKTKLAAKVRCKLHAMARCMLLAQLHLAGWLGLRPSQKWLPKSQSGWHRWYQQYQVSASLLLNFHNS
jgi:hypothetical protein